MRARDLPPQWSAVVPVRDFDTAKSRLRGVLPDATVAQLARSLAIRVIGALQSSEWIARICVVSDVDLSRDLVWGKSSLLVQQPGGGLNAAVCEGISRVRALSPPAPVLVIHADLPGATSHGIAELLRQARRAGRDSYLPDEAGTGTTALTFFPESERMPAFGSESAERHEELGFQRIDLPRLSGLRNDLDTVDDYALLVEASSAFGHAHSVTGA